MVFLKIQKCFTHNRLNLAAWISRSHHEMKADWSWLTKFTENSNLNSLVPIRCDPNATIPVKLQVVVPEKPHKTLDRQPSLQEYKMPFSEKLVRYTKASGDGGPSPTKESSPANEHFEGSFIGSYIDAFKKRFFTEDATPESKAEEKSVHSSELKSGSHPKQRK